MIPAGACIGVLGACTSTIGSAWVPGINPYGFITSNGMRLVLDLL